MTDPDVRTGPQPQAPQAQAASNGYIVQATDVSRRYGEGDAAVDALTDVSVEFERGPLHGDHGAVGVGQVDPDAHPGRA